MTPLLDGQEGLKAGVQELGELAVRLEWIAATFARLRADLQITESRIAAIAQSIEDTRLGGNLELHRLR
jgi:hypothetical protein